MTQITIRPTPYHLTLPDNAPIKETAQIAMAEWLKVNKATDLQHLDEDRGFTVQVETTKPVRDRFALHSGIVTDHYTANLPDGSRIALEGGHTPNPLHPVVYTYTDVEVSPLDVESVTRKWRDLMRGWLGGSR